MNSKWSCEICNKKYKTFNGFKNHKCKNRREDFMPKEKSVGESKIVKKRRRGKIMKIKLFNLLSPTYRIDISEIKSALSLRQ